MTEIGVRKFNWSECSPGANPTEHVWDMLGRRSRTHSIAPTTMNELSVELQEEWENIQHNAIRWLITVMKRHVQAIIRFGYISQYEILKFIVSVHFLILYLQSLFMLT